MQQHHQVLSSVQLAHSFLSFKLACNCQGCKWLYRVGSGGLKGQPVTWQTRAEAEVGLFPGDALEDLVAALRGVVAGWKGGALMGPSEAEECPSEDAEAAQVTSQSASYTCSYAQSTLPYSSVISSRSADWSSMHLA